MIATLVILTAGRVGYTALSELCVEMFWLLKLFRNTTEIKTYPSIS
jgi:hypothetical protein